MGLRIREVALGEVGNAQVEKSLAMVRDELDQLLQVYAPLIKAPFTDGKQTLAIKDVGVSAMVCECHRLQVCMRTVIVPGFGAQIGARNLQYPLEAGQFNRLRIGRFRPVIITFEPCQLRCQTPGLGRILPRPHGPRLVDQLARRREPALTD